MLAHLAATGAIFVILAAWVGIREWRARWQDQAGETCTETPLDAGKCGHCALSAICGARSPHP